MILQYILFGLCYLMIGGFLAGFFDDNLGDLELVLMFFFWPLFIVAMGLVFIGTFPMRFGAWIRDKINRGGRFFK